MTEQIITIEAMEAAVSLFGSFDENIRNSFFSCKHFYCLKKFFVHHFSYHPFGTKLQIKFTFPFENHLYQNHQA